MLDIFENTDINIAIVVIFAVACFVAILLYLIFKSPFSYPYFSYDFDVSGKRDPQIEDLLDSFLIAGKFPYIQQHKKKISRWKKECHERIERSLLKKLRTRQYNDALDDRHAFEFRLIRSQTRYIQRNYIKSSYKVKVPTYSFFFSYKRIKERYDALSEIDFECTLREYHGKNQRKLATREMREKIMVRDNYTCQLCGKYMPDEVGLQIDHIIPISKGGKTIKSNLRVLCSKCNSSKSNKIL